MILEVCVHCLPLLLENPETFSIPARPDLNGIQWFKSARDLPINSNFHSNRFFGASASPCLVVWIGGLVVKISFSSPSTGSRGSNTQPPIQTTKKG